MGDALACLRHGAAMIEEEYLSDMETRLFEGCQACFIGSKGAAASPSYDNVMQLVHIMGNAVKDSLVDSTLSDRVSALILSVVERVLLAMTDSVRLCACLSIVSMCV